MPFCNKKRWRRKRRKRNLSRSMCRWIKKKPKTNKTHLDWQLLPLPDWMVKTPWRMKPGKHSPYHKSVLRTYVRLWKEMALRYENVFYKHALQDFLARLKCQTKKWYAVAWAHIPIILHAQLSQINTVITGERHKLFNNYNNPVFISSLYQ